MLSVQNPKELLKMQPKQIPTFVVGDLAEFENETYTVVKIKGQALELQQQVYPFESFLVSNDVVTKVTKVK